jgi:hypothetical protein
MVWLEQAVNNGPDTRQMGAADGWAAAEERLAALNPVPPGSVAQAASSLRSIERLGEITTDRWRSGRRTALRRGFRVVVSAAAVAVPVLIVAALFLYGPNEKKQTATTPAWGKLSILDRPQTPDDRTEISYDGIDPDSTRLAQRIGGGAIYLARGDRGDRTCLLVVGPNPSQASNVPCWPDGPLGFWGLVPENGVPGLETPITLGVVPDGIDSVRIADRLYEVVGNTFAGHYASSEDRTADLIGPGANVMRAGPIGALFVQLAKDSGTQALTLPAGQIALPSDTTSETHPRPVPIAAPRLPLIVSVRKNESRRHGEIDLADVPWMGSAKLVFVKPDCPACLLAARSAERESQRSAGPRPDIGFFVVFLGSVENGLAWARTSNVRLPIVVDEHGVLSGALRTTAVPDTVTLAGEQGWFDRRRDISDEGPWQSPGYTSRALQGDGPHISLLDQDSTQIDQAVMSAISGDPDAPFGCGTNLDSLRPATESDGIAVFAGTGSQGRPALVVKGIGTVALTCSDPSTGTHGVFWVESSSTAPWFMAGIVEDGYEEAVADGKRWPIRNNGFVISLPRRPARVTFSGPRGELILEHLALDSTFAFSEFYEQTPLSQTRLP